MRTFLIGARTINREMGDYFSGLIDEVSVYNKVLSPEAVKNLYCGLRPEGCLE